jgi:hypothetical protein
MSSFGGAQPKVVTGKQKFKENNDPNATKRNNNSMSEDDPNRTALNIMYDKRVFRGNTHGMGVLKADAILTPAQRDDLRFKAEREKRKFEMIK